MSYVSRAKLNLKLAMLIEWVYIYNSLIKAIYLSFINLFILLSELDSSLDSKTPEQISKQMNFFFKKLYVLFS